MRFLAPLWSSPERERAITLGSSIWNMRLLLSSLSAAAVALWMGLSPELGVDATFCVLLAIFAWLRFAGEATRGLFLPVGHVGKLVGFDFLRLALGLPVIVVFFRLYGLTGVFGALTGLHLLLFVASAAVLFRVIPIRPLRLRWSVLRPHLRYSLSTFVGSVAEVFQSRFAVYAVAAWVAWSEAGYLGLAVQIHGLLQLVYLSGRNALMPILAELETHGERDKLRVWGGMMLRYGTAATCVAAVGWGLLGEQAVLVILGDDFAPVYPCATAILIGVVFFCAASSCVGLLYIRNLAGTASFTMVVHAAVTVVGLLLVGRGEGEGVATRIAWVYTLSAFVFFGFGYTALAWFGGIRLPLARTLLLMLPVGLAWVATGWEAGLGARLAAAALFTASYLGLATASGLIPRSELREIVAVARSAGSARKAAA
jgi:O-antigen/teichoic acid export membrane protein